MVIPQSDLAVVTQSEIGVHDIESRVDLHDERVREMEIAEQAQTKPPAITHLDLDARCGLKAEVLVGGLAGRYLFGKSKQAAFGLKVGLDGPVAAPLHAKADRIDAHSWNVLASLLADCDRIGRIAINIGIEGLVEEHERKKFGDIIHLRLEKIVPGMTIIFDARGEQLFVVTGTEEPVIPVGNQSFDDDFLRRWLGMAFSDFAGLGLFCRSGFSRETKCIR